MFKQILVPVDGSDHANRAVEVAGDLAQHYGAPVLFLYVLTQAGGSNVPRELESFERIEHIRITEQDLLASAGRQILNAAAATARDRGAAACDIRLESGDPASRIVAVAADSGADLIVMGRRGLGDLSGLLFGSVSHKVAQAVDCCCLTVK